mgnify:FL=1
MHTFNYGHTVFHYNSDLSGVIHVVREGSGLRDSREDAYIPGEALLAFAAHYVRNRRISALEDASDAEILGIQKEDLS